MNEPQTLREYLNRPVTADEVETGGRWERILIKHNDPILDAHIIRTCPTCGGSRSVTGAEDFPGGDEGYDVTCSPCPDCADAPVWVIAPEALDGVADVLGYVDWESASAIERAHIMSVLQALLPRARRAKEVVKASGLMHAYKPQVSGPNGESCDVTFTMRDEVWDTPRDIAVLHNEQEKEHE